jgi:GNAT superfamily N-acetyltransferase
MPNDGALMRIRRAAAEDIEELSALVMSAKAHWGYPQAQLQAWRSSLEVSADAVSARPTFVGELDGLLIGFYSLIPAGEAWELSDLWILPRFMKQGFGRALLMHAAQTAAQGAATCIVIDADPYAEPFYLACGAHRTGEVAAPIPGQPDRVRPHLRLLVMRSGFD